MRINKFLAKTGLASRRQSENLVIQGKIEINGVVIEDLSTQVDIENDEVTYQGKVLELPSESKVIAINKPKGYLCTQFDPQQRETIYELIPKPLQHLHYIGRLDYQSRGLLLLTDDGELSRRLTHPEFEIPRYYLVTLNHELDVESKVKLEAGLLLDDGTQFRPAKVKVFGKKVEMRLVEGKKREIREMMHALDYKVKDLQRVSYASIELDDLEEGQWRVLSVEEVDELYNSVELTK